MVRAGRLPRHDRRQRTSGHAHVNGGETAEREQNRFLAALQQNLQAFLDKQVDILTPISSETRALLEAISALASGGKRMRALLCYWGWRGAGGPADAGEITTAGTALELFQAAALIHDDIIDRSDTRRGAPSVHRRFSNLHLSSGWALDPNEFGRAAAILAGDLCLSFSEEVFSSVGPRTAYDTRARAVFNRMRTEVMAGQYLDILEEVAGSGKPDGTAVERAQAILRYKSAKYSTEHPLMLGGALAGSSEARLQGYAEFALPLGEAFQLRDDVLGVYGDPSATGKPAGDDLREGKRTVLIGYALSHANRRDRAFVDEQLGNPALDPDQIQRCRAILIDSGALASTETLIEQLRGEAFAALARLDLDDVTRQALTNVAASAVKRSA